MSNYEQPTQPNDFSEQLSAEEQVLNEIQREENREQQLVAMKMDPFEGSELLELLGRPPEPVDLLLFRSLYSLADESPTPHASSLPLNASLGLSRSAELLDAWRRDVEANNTMPTWYEPEQ